MYLTHITREDELVIRSWIRSMSAEALTQEERESLTEFEEALDCHKREPVDVPYLILDRWLESQMRGVITLDEFRATRRVCHAILNCDHEGSGCEYFGRTWILCNPHPNQKRWYLSIENREYSSDDLAELEVVLHDWVVRNFSRDDLVTWQYSTAGLAVEYEAWCQENDLPPVCAEEQRCNVLSSYQRSWLERFISRWDEADDRETKERENSNG